MAPHGKDDKLLCIASCIERLVGDRAVRIGCIPDIPR
jgi:hypothetical protein